VLGPSEGGLGGQDATDGFPASGHNTYPSGANAFFAEGNKLTNSKSQDTEIGRPGLNMSCQEVRDSCCTTQDALVACKGWRWAQDAHEAYRY